MPEAHAGMMVTPSVRLVRPLGEGGMGAVWVAEHTALRTQVVVKFIASGLKDSKEAIERFSREAAAAAQVKSPHVVQTFDHGVTDKGVPYIVMELLEGQDLGAHLDRHGRCSPGLVLGIVAQLARALDRAHERGIVHRDIKPGNIFLCDHGAGEVFVKLLDFGIAKGVELPRIDSGTKTGAMIGSPFYMSPEQILGAKDVDHRSDLWSVGVVVFEALTGRKPFDAETMGGLAIKIHSEPLPLPSSVEAALPAAVDAWFLRACARDRNERFASGKELSETLARALGGEMPKALEIPHVSTGRREVAAHAPTLAAGATTEAGLVRSASSGGTRTRVLLLAGTAVVLGFASFAAVSSYRTARSDQGRHGDGRVAADPATSVPARAALVTSVAPPIPAAPAPLVAPPAEGTPTGEGAVEQGERTLSATPARRGTPVPVPKAATHAARHGGSPKAAPSGTVSPGQASPSPLSPPVPPAPPPPARPAATGHDIF